MKSDVVDAIIEIPYRSRNKFEIKNGKIKLDRVLYSAMAYPAEYTLLIIIYLLYNLKWFYARKKDKQKSQYLIDYFVSSFWTLIASFPL